MSLDEFTTLYLSWRNEFVTMEAFAREYGLSYAVATEIITLGRAIGNLGQPPVVKTMAELEAESPEGFRNPM